MQLLELPDHLLLRVFSILPVKERCLLGRVCTRFRRITCDNSLWRHVDLLPYRLNVGKTWKVMRSHLSDCLLTFKIRGFLGKTGLRRKEFAITNAMLEDLQTRCPNLREFHLHWVNIDEIDSSRLPKTISKLVIRGCTWPAGWLKNADLPELRVLDVIDTRILDAAKVEDFLKFPNIEELYLNFCYRLGDKAVKMLTENLPNLKYLNLSDTSITDLAIHHLCRALPGLTKLNIDCTGIEDGSVETIATGLKNLQELSVWKCKKLTEESFRPLKKVKTLQKLTMTSGAISPALWEEFNIELPACKIVQLLRHEKRHSPGFDN